MVSILTSPLFLYWFTGVVLAIIFVVWVLAILAGTMKEFLDTKNETFYGVIVTVNFYFVPLTIILGAYGTIFQIARGHARGRGISSFKKVLPFGLYYQPFKMVLENSSLQISKCTKVYYFLFKGHKEKR